MRIVHLSTYDIGGAAISAQRLHNGLLKKGIDSSFLALQIFEKDQYPNKFKFNHRTGFSLGQRIRRKLGIVTAQSEKNSLVLQKMGGTYEGFSFPFTDYFVEDHTLVQSADILHLHWVSGFINYPSFFKKVKIPIVWTFHDMNPLLGGFHYLGDVKRNESEFRSIEERIKKEKSRHLRNSDNLIIVTPSRWLQNHLNVNEALSNKIAFHIPYGIDLTVFKPHDKVFAKSVFNLPIDRKILLFVSDVTSNYRKGFDLLIAAINEIDLKEEFLLVNIGDSGGETFVANSVPVVSLGKIRDERLMSLLYSAADVFILPSREDNFPNVMLESMACGTPVIAFANGGMREVVRTGFNGILISELSVDGLAKAICDFIQGEYCFDLHFIRSFALENFDLGRQATRYIELYKSLLSGK